MKYCGSPEDLEDWKRWRVFEHFNPEMVFWTKSLPGQSNSRGADWGCGSFGTRRLDHEVLLCSLDCLGRRKSLKDVEEKKMPQFEPFKDHFGSK